MPSARHYGIANMKNPLVVKENEVGKLIRILDMFSQLDDIRWSVQDNYNLINYYCGAKNLSDDEKLLTHWLCYIADRQTPYKRVWEVGGYVISHMVRAFAQEDGRSVRNLFRSYVFRDDGDKLGLKCPLEAVNEAADTRLARYGIEMGAVEVKFASRYPSDDLLRMYHTLEVLAKHHGKSLAVFCEASFRPEDDDRQAIRRMATALDKLTYAVRTVPAGQFDQGLDEMEKKAEEFRMPPKAKPGHMFNRKRLWCCVRDYLKSPEFNKVFVAALKKRSAENPERWNRQNDELKQALDAIELPGDVWNNSETVRDGLFTPCLSGKPQSWKMPQTIRGVHKLLSEDRDLRFYPEQLDVTFDFVPRMCERSMCNVCLFGDGIGGVCHQKPGLSCPVALVSCGYRHDCNPAECRLKRNEAKAYCRNSTAASLPS